MQWPYNNWNNYFSPLNNNWVVRGAHHLDQGNTRALLLICACTFHCCPHTHNIYTDHSRTLIELLEEKDWLTNENELLKINIAHLARWFIIKKFTCSYLTKNSCDIGSRDLFCRTTQSLYPAASWSELHCIIIIIQVQSSFNIQEHQHQHISNSSYNIIQQCHVFTSCLYGLATLWRGKCLHDRYRHHHSCMNHHMCTVLQLHRGSRSPCSHLDTCMRDHRCN